MAGVAAFPMAAMVVVPAMALPAAVVDVETRPRIIIAAVPAVIGWIARIAGAIIAIIIVAVIIADADARIAVAIIIGGAGADAERGGDRQHGGAQA
jgi:hypothetical protein